MNERVYNNRAYNDRMDDSLTKLQSPAEPPVASLEGTVVTLERYQLQYGGHWNRDDSHQRPHPLTPREKGNLLIQLVGSMWVNPTPIEDLMEVGDAVFYNFKMSYIAGLDGLAEILAKENGMQPISDEKISQRYPLCKPYDVKTARLEKHWFIGIDESSHQFVATYQGRVLIHGSYDNQHELERNICLIDEVLGTSRSQRFTHFMRKSWLYSYSAFGLGPLLGIGATIGYAHYSSAQGSYDGLVGLLVLLAPMAFTLPVSSFIRAQYIQSRINRISENLPNYTFTLFKKSQ